MENLIYQKDTYLIRGICMEVHNILGHGFAEIVYKDALAYDFKTRNIAFQREKKYEIVYREIVLPHFFYADFIVINKIILEIKAKDSIANEDIAQAINYLKASKCELALIINFGQEKLEVKRIVY